MLAALYNPRQIIYLFFVLPVPIWAVVVFMVFMDASGFLPAGQADHWAVYLNVADTDAALATVTRLGWTRRASSTNVPLPWRR